MTAPAFSLDKASLNYVSDESGNKTAVVVPIEVWAEIIAVLEINTLKNTIFIEKRKEEQYSILFLNTLTICSTFL